MQIIKKKYKYLTNRTVVALGEVLIVLVYNSKKSHPKYFVIP